jgi:Meiotically up-regulated gene 113
MDNLEELIHRFDKITFSLSREDIFEFDKHDNGPINNVIKKIERHCYGVQLFENDDKITVEMFYVNNDRELIGDIIRLDLDDKNYFHLLMRFTAILAEKYNGVNAILAFNTYQNKLRGFLEKLDFFTTTSLELEPYKGKNAMMISTAPRGIKNIILIDPADFYRTFFNNNYKNENMENLDYVYLMVNNDTGYIKIGTSRNPRHREKTLHSQEPKIFIIAKWRCEKKVEKELHEKFKAKRIRGEWFNLQLIDLKRIQEFMATYNFS